MNTVTKNAIFLGGLGIAQGLISHFGNMPILSGHSFSEWLTSTSVLGLLIVQLSYPWCFRSIWPALSALLVSGLLSFNLVYMGEVANSHMNTFTLSIGIVYCAIWLLMLWISILLVLTMIQQRKLTLPYDALFFQTWTQPFVLALALLFTHICWILLASITYLYTLIALPIVSDVVTKPLFIWPVTGLFFGIGLAIAQYHRSLINKLKKSVLTMAHYLILFFTGLMVAFFISLPFGAIETRITNALLTMNVLFIILFNGLYQDGRSKPPFSALGRGFLYVGLMAMAVSALVSFGIELDQFINASVNGGSLQHIVSWRYDHWPVLLFKGFIMLYALGYALAVFRHGDYWMPWVKNLNRQLAIALLVVFWLLYSPVGFWALSL